MAKEKIDSTRAQQLMAQVSEVFSPAAPINRRDLFAGRLDQLQRVFEAVNTRGQHAVIFGERGVGKTSLANIVQEILIANKAVVAKMNCSKDDKFSQVWKQILTDIEISRDTGRVAIGFMNPLKSVDDTFSASDLVPEDPSPNDILKVIRVFGKSAIIFDEFDRFGDETSLFADTIKALSDSSIDCTIILVGVAQDIDGLIREHASIDRALSQIMMPRMNTKELNEILNNAMDSLGTRMNADAQSMIVLLSQGLPHYTHVLGRSSTLEAIHSGTLVVRLSHVRKSIEAAIQNTQQSIRNAYQVATASPRKDTLFKQVLLACALAPVDELGFFTSANVKEPLSTIMGKPYDIPNFSQHLDKFSSEDRGNVLQKAGTQRRFRFRFSNPLLQPFVVMRGIADNMLSEDLLEVLRKRTQS